MEERIRLTRRKLQIPYTAKEHNRQGTSQCYTEKAPNAWQRRGTQKTRNTYNQPNRPNRPNRQTSQTKHQALPKGQRVSVIRLVRVIKLVRSVLGLRRFGAYSCVIHVDPRANFPRQLRVTPKKPQTPGTAMEHKRHKTPTINTNDRQSAQITDQPPGTIERAAKE